MAVEILLALLLFALAPNIAPKERPDPKVFGIEVDSGETAKAEEKAEAEKPARRKPAAAEPDTPPPPEIVPPPPPLPETPPLPPSFIRLTRRDYAASDIARAPVRAGDSAASAGDDAPDSALASGRGPHGETLYAAEWHVRPTDAQLRTYIPARARTSGWGLIACRTVDAYRVEDCQELGESPRGSGLAGAVRQAAWQFRVRPPRVGGKTMVGSWVSIRIDYTIER